MPWVRNPGKNILILHTMSKIRAPKIDESAICCNCRIRKSVKILLWIRNSSKNIFKISRSVRRSTQYAVRYFELNSNHRMNANLIESHTHTRESSIIFFQDSWYDLILQYLELAYLILSTRYFNRATKSTGKRCEAANVTSRYFAFKS